MPPVTYRKTARLTMARASDIMGLMAQLAKADGDADRQLDLVKALSGVTMTMDLLKATKVGGAVKPLRKAEHAPLADAANDLIKAWRAIAATVSRRFAQSVQCCVVLAATA